MPTYGHSYCVFCRTPINIVPTNLVRKYGQEFDSTPFDWLDTGLILLRGDKEPKGRYYDSGLSQSLSVIDGEVRTIYHSYATPEPMFLHKLCHDLLRKWDGDIAIRHGYPDKTGGLIYYALSRRKEEHICDEICQYYPETDSCSSTRYIHNQDCQFSKFDQYNQLYLLTNPKSNPNQQERLLKRIRYLFRRCIIRDWFEKEQFQKKI